jgi:hypothetical protein
MYVLLNKIIFSLYLGVDVFYVILSGICLIFFILCYYFQIQYVALYFKLDSKESFHYDKLTQNFDLIIFLQKITISLNKSLISIINNNNVLRYVIFLDYLLIFLLFILTYDITRDILVNKNLLIVTNLKLNV